MQRLSHGSLRPSRSTALSAEIVNTTKMRHILSVPYLTPLLLNLCQSPMYLLSWLVNQQTFIQHLLKDGCYSRTPASFCGSEDIFFCCGSVLLLPYQRSSKSLHASDLPYALVSFNLCFLELLSPKRAYILNWFLAILKILISPTELRHQ